MKKKILSLALVLVMALSLIPNAAAISTASDWAVPHINSALAKGFITSA